MSGQAHLPQPASGGAEGVDEPVVLRGLERCERRVVSGLEEPAAVRHRLCDGLEAAQRELPGVGAGGLNGAERVAGVAVEALLAAVQHRPAPQRLGAVDVAMYGEGVRGAGRDERGAVQEPSGWRRR